MKKTMKTMLAFVAGAMALSACSNDELLEEQKIPSKGNMTFTATVSDEEGTATRASLNGLNIVWNQGDEISVFSGANLTTNNKMTLASEAGTTSASFTGNCDKATQYYAIYPYNANHSAKDANDNSMGCKVVWNNAEQIAVKGSFDPSVPMIAKASNVSETATSVPLQFRNIYSFVKVTTDYKCKSITLKSKQENIAIEFRYFTFDNDGNLDPKYMSTNQSDVITLKGKDGTNIEAGTYYIAVPYGITLSKGFDLTFTSVFDDTKKYTKSTSKSITFTRNKVLNLGSVTLRGSDLETLEGAGTSENPYKINDFDDLKTFQRWITAEKGETYKKFYLQTADIDAQGQEMAPIGTAEHRFWGTYDGGNHYIKNLCIKGSFEYTSQAATIIPPTNRATALFGAIKAATICNLTIWNPSFSNGNNGCYQAVSPFVGVSYSADADFENSRCKILNCRLKGECSLNFTSIGGEYICYGGFVADSQSHLEIKDCTTDMNLQISYSVQSSDKVDAHIGGFVGTPHGVNETNSGSLERDAYVKIHRCRNNSQTMKFTDKCSESNINIGGFIGYAEDFASDDDVACKLYNNVNNASIEVTKQSNCRDHVYIGGFIGNNDSDGYGSVNPCVMNCVNNGNLKAVNYYSVHMGGINGCNYDNNTEFTNCVNNGTLTENEFAISAYYGTLKECWNCKNNYSLANSVAIVNSSNCGQKSINDIVDHMNNTSIVTSDPNNFFHRWKLTDGKLDLEF